MKILQYALVTSGICLATAAGARDARLRPAPVAPEPAYDWSGAYVGGYVGGAHGLWTVDFYRNNNHGHAEEGADGFAAGAWVGYNYMLNRNWLVGVEAEFGNTSADQSNNIFDNDTSYASYGPYGSIRARIGYAFDRLLIFATTGLALANITNDIQKGRNAGEEVVYDDQLRTGFALGGGIEYAFTPQWVGRAEYLYSNYGSVTLVNRDGNRADFENELHLLRVGASYRF